MPSRRICQKTKVGEIAWQRKGSSPVAVAASSPEATAASSPEAVAASSPVAAPLSREEEHAFKALLDTARARAPRAQWFSFALIYMSFSRFLFEVCFLAGASFALFRRPAIGARCRLHL